MYRLRNMKKIGSLILIIFMFLTLIFLINRKLSAISDINSMIKNTEILKSKVVGNLDEEPNLKSHQIIKLQEEIQDLYKKLKKYEILLNESHVLNNKETVIGIFEKRVKYHEFKSSEGPITKDEIQGGEPSDLINKRRRDKVRDMMKFAWKNYVKYAWGENELRPISKVGHSASIFGQTKMGISIIDSIDTLYIMGLNEEFKDSLNWIKENLDFNLSTDVSVFEMTIRFLGGLLTAYTFTKDEIILRKATVLGDHLLQAFDSTGDLPYSLINFQNNFAHNYNWAEGSCCILSEIGTLHMEFAYLSELTGNSTYVKKVNRVREILYKANKPDGLYMNFINSKSHNWCGSQASLAGLGDSFYEYLLKEFLRSRKKDKLALKMYNQAIESMEAVGMFPVSPMGHMYVADYKRGSIMDKMDHLACFAGGMFALGSIYTKYPTKWLNIAENITNTCHESYNNANSKLGPESFHFENNIEGVAISQQEKIYLLRPETFESYFYLWRITKDTKYREWAYEGVLALEKHAKVENGFSGIKDVYSIPVIHDDVQQSFLMAETLKYLYLIFSDDTLIPLDRWVFNTEGHPFPIRDVIF